MQRVLAMISLKTASLLLNKNQTLARSFKNGVRVIVNYAQVVY